MQRVEIPCEGRHLAGILRRPERDAKPPWLRNWVWLKSDSRRRGHA